MIGQYLDQIDVLAEALDAPKITGATPVDEREVLYQAFRVGEISLLVVSKVANFSIDLPEASVAIQVSGSFGSRQEEAQRLGRLLRPKESGNTASFYTLIARDTVDQDFAQNRQRFLAEQGYSYTILDARRSVAGVDHARRVRPNSPARLDGDTSAHNGTYDMTAPRILVVDDEPNIRDLLITSLRFAGFQVKAVSNGAQTISAVLEEEPDLIILDVMLPDMNGFSVTKRLRGAGYTAPILFLTAKDETEDKITGLNAGGDDYVTKPFSLDEIVARIQAILRRTMQADEESMIRAGELTMDQDTHDVLVGDVSIDLSPTEFKLLRYLMLNPNRVLSKAQILDHVWEYDFNGDAGIVESYISYLRRKIDPHSTEPLIQTKRGFGYMLKAGKTA